MAYSRGPTTALQSSASLLPGNLAVVIGVEGGRSLTYAVTHKNCVNLVHTASGVCTQEQVAFDTSDEDKDPASHLIQARWCRLQSSWVVLVLTSFKGFKILEWNGSSMLYHNQFETPPGSFGYRFARGVASVKNSVCVGTSEGPILVLSVPPMGADPEVVFTRQLQGHLVAVCDLATNDQGQLASCDESGMIIVWADPASSAESQVVINEPSGAACLCLCFWGSLLIGGFANGVVRIYDAKTGCRKIEIAAHSRCITALDVATEAGLLLTASEDSTVMVWSLNNGKVSQVFVTMVTNSLLCGGRFCNPQGSKFALTTYDSTEIITFDRS